MTSQPPINDNRVLDTVILGAGFGGLCMGIRLRQSGVDDFVILEKGDDIGGTWRDNTYPGCACDVQSHMYSFSFEGKPDWTKRYAPWYEIYDYIQNTADRHGMRPFIRLNQEVVSARYDDDTATWTIGTRDGKQWRCRHFVMAAGPLHVPSWPNIPGLDRFQGRMFHSARWEHDYDLRGKKVVSIGTGASAIQYVPQVAKEAQQLYVLQRTPAWLVPRDERQYSRLEKEAFRRFPLLRKLHRARLYWSNESRVWPIFQPRLARALQQLAKLYIRWQVKDPEIARKLTPDYTMGCKRILISNDYYPTFNRDNVELVTEGIREIREHSVVMNDGREIEADCIIVGTGFVVDPRKYLSQFELTGRNGQRLLDTWKDGAEAYLGIHVNGFPNMFQLVGPNTGLGHNSILFMIECQVNHILEARRLKRKRGADSIEVRPEAQAAFIRDVQQSLEGTVWTSGCQSWYQQEDGRNIALWPYSTWKYWLRTRRVREADFRLEKAPATVDTEDAEALPATGS